MGDTMKTMKFVFDERKAGQAAAWLLRRYGKPMEAERLIMLLYLVDRRTFIESGYPLTGDDFVSTAAGPTLRALSCLMFDNEESTGNEWRTYVQQVGSDRLTHTNVEDVGALSERDRKRLGEALDKHHSMTCSRMSKSIQRLPEWQAPMETFGPIDPKNLLRNAGYSSEEIEEVAGLVGSIHWLHSTLGQ